jgi:hypothetical protein
MTTPQTLTIRTFTDRAEALAHFVLRAGEAPGFWRSTMPSAVRWTSPWRRSRWTKVVGILRDDDTVHAARLTNETAAAVIERKGRMDASSCTSAPGSTRRRWTYSKARCCSTNRGKGRRVQPASARAGSFSSGNGGRRCPAGAARTPGAGNPPPPALAGPYPCRTRPAACPGCGLVRRQLGRLLARAE